MQSAVRDRASIPGKLVVGVEYERSISGSHEHVAGVWTSEDVYVARNDVLRSLAVGDSWWTLDDGRRVALRRVTHCPWPGCSVIPYLFVGGADPGAADRGRT